MNESGQSTNGVEVHRGPSGMGARVYGPNAIVIVFAAVMMIAAGWLQERNATRLVNEIREVGRANVQEVRAASKITVMEHRAIERSNYLLACVLQYPPEQRATMRTASSIDAFRQLCPWLPEDPRRDQHTPQ